MLKTFDTFYETFKKLHLWNAMEKTKENSPYHREESVAVHTDMAISYYLKNFASQRTARQQAIALMSLLFHDAGKPTAKTEKFKEERGNYFSFGGHEQKSARIFEQFAAQNWNSGLKLKSTFGFKDTDLYVITWIIENHLWHDLSKRSNVYDRLKSVLTSSLFDDGDLEVCYYDQLISDQSGRVSDNAQSELDDLDSYIMLVKAATPIEKFFREGAPTLTLLVGASGSGKSTYCTQNPVDHYFSFDDIRIRLYEGKTGKSNPDVIKHYEKAFDYCDKHRSEFRHYHKKIFDLMLKSHKDIIVDNTNTSHKSRMELISEAKDRGYKIRAVMFPIYIGKLLERMDSRTDKRVPRVAVISQFNGIAMPWLGSEVDELVVMTHNLN